MNFLGGVGRMICGAVGVWGACASRKNEGAD